MNRRIRLPILLVFAALLLVANSILAETLTVAAWNLEGRVRAAFSGT
jgi:hypothetical protein